MDAVHAIARAGEWSGVAIDTVTLDHDLRHRRRLVLRTAGGRDVLLDLPEATRLRDGDALVIAAGCVRVAAAPEPLVELRAADAGACARLAWHLGNRHVAAQLGDRWLRIRRDHVLEELARRLGADVVPIEAPFEPEAGAYAAHAHAADRPAPWR